MGPFNIMKITSLLHQVVTVIFSQSFTGFASTTVPMYIAECSPVHLRGRLVTLNNVFITGGQFVASVVDGAFSWDKKDGWR